MNTEWITDRLPTYAESLNGCVYAWIEDHLPPIGILEYDTIKSGTPWQPIPVPEPYVKPKTKTWTLEWNKLGYWILNNRRKKWDSVVIPYITEDQDEVAQQIEDIYNKALP
jgi:hypothetical protein